MLRSISLSVVVILLLSSGVFACIGQAEGFSISATNMVQTVGGIGLASSGNIVFAGNGQTVLSAGTSAIQREAGLLTQTATVAGIGGETSVLQNASISGLQGQIAQSGVPGIKAQGQTLTVGLDNDILLVGGIGGAVGSQGFVGGQGQVIVTPNGIFENYQVVGVTQSAIVAGGLGTSIEVNNTVDVAMGQGQIVTGGNISP
jgi:hypothetical protein